ncbi:cell wall-binding repeat-containing protein [Clostridium luticellarii]|uniref:N-acetylmuramoyl-L-alanine amidase LytC n=1 Tax=Clostridium luticellarii TaxID=1691940 RepID=A0A2T0BP85_9CLOT|nr:cell wall-binding repeat-containing protein [Clostridium luticellarii]PRR85701.1 N-acetylmuramoyl-L-alanine amidase LytC precursor [Clostridium luticellarii]
MSKKSTKALASAALMSLVLTTALSAGPVKAAQGEVTRVSGADRYATASQVATTNWADGSDNVVLVSGEGYADAVSASALAKKLDAPILLTKSDSLSADAQTALETLKPKNIYVVGGTASISQSIRDELAKSYTLTELGGANRYETNTAVAEELVKLGVSASDVLVVGGEGFSDALSVAPVAAAKGQILLLANNNSSQPAIDFVKENNSKVTVVGTSNVINDTVYNALGATTRVDGGTDRFDTNLKVLDNFKDSLKTDKLYIANATAATPDDLYADALVASAVAGKYSAPLVLVDTETSDATTKAIAYIGNNGKTSDVQLIGGTGVVSENTETAINNALKGENPDQDQASEVQSVEATGLNQIKVTFNGEVDEDTAEELTNYKLDGTLISDEYPNSKAVLQDDNKTVLITLDGVQDQNDDLDVTVKKGILSEDKSNTIPEFTQTVTFSDTTAPTLDSVSVRGNKKITVKFSEPVNIGKDEDASDVYSKFKINDKNLTSFGLDTSTTTAKDAVKDSNDYYWTSQIDFYFSSALPTGNNTLKVSDGEDNALEDAAGFPISEVTQDFDVDTLDTAPEIQSIEANDDGTVYINFDRPMDTKTATKAANYKINNGDLPKDPELKKDDTQVKISGVSGLTNKNSNTLYISDNVKDAYGNKVADDTYESFTLDEDDSKPTVTSVSTLDDDTIRVRFSKDVDSIYAVNTSNYKLEDSDGTDITKDTSKGIENITVPGDSDVENGDSTDVVDINVKAKLTDSKYTLTIKNIIDTAKTPNTMDDYTTTFDGSEDVTPTVTGTYKVEGNARKVIVYFNKEMDSSSLSDLDNYKYKNGDGDIKALPSGTDITPSGDNKSAVVEFPSSYGTDKEGSNLIKALDVLDTIKDANGNSLDISYTGDIEDADNNPNTATIDSNSVKVAYDDDDLTVQFKFNNPIDTLDYEDFEVNGVKPSTGSLDGNVVTLRFNDGDLVEGTEKDDSGFVGKSAGYTPTKIQAVKFAGPKAIKITTIDEPKTVDIAGNTIDAISAEDPVYAYDFEAAPKTIAQEWNAGLLEDGTTGYVDVVFDTAIDNSGIDVDDFVFTTSNGTTLTPDSAAVSTGTTVGNEANTVRFTFNNSASSFADTKTIKVRIKDTASIRTIKDNDDSNAYYKASDDDIAGRTITIGTVGAVK